MTTSKQTRSGGATLPEWPRFEEYARRPTTSVHETEANYYADLAEAALARMEALEKAVRYAGVHAHSDVCLGGAYGSACTCGLSELLAACARKEAGR